MNRQHRGRNDYTSFRQHSPQLEGEMPNQIWVLMNFWCQDQHCSLGRSQETAVFNGINIYKEDKVDKKQNWPNIYQNIGWHHPAEAVFTLLSSFLRSWHDIVQGWWGSMDTNMAAMSRHPTRGHLASILLKYELQTSLRRWHGHKMSCMLFMGRVQWVCLLGAAGCQDGILQAARGKWVVQANLAYSHIRSCLFKHWSAGALLQNTQPQNSDFTK